ncbi:MAG: LPXTG cell wall anchor domain-containing protein [Methanomicrobia archaeon]|nr:LPXTG cell wall anchor domain-containing protein [Methanomicrobia archaeon]
MTDALGNPVLMALNSGDGIDLLGSEATIAVAILSFAGIIFISLAGFLFYQKTKKQIL